MIVVFLGGRGIVIVHPGFHTVPPKGMMMGIGIKKAGVVYLVMVVRDPGRYVNCQEPEREVNIGTSPARERETLIHQGVVVVFVGGLVIGGTGVIGMVLLAVLVGVGVMTVIGVTEPPEVVGAGTYVMIMEVVMVKVVVRPSLVIAVVITIGITDNEVVVKTGITLVIGPGSLVRVRESEPCGKLVMEEGGACEFEVMMLEFGRGGGTV